MQTERLRASAKDRLKYATRLRWSATMHAIRMRLLFARLAPIFVVLAVLGCSVTSPFNERAYDIATTAKVDALAVVTSATEPYATHASEVHALKLEIDKAYEFA